MQRGLVALGDSITNGEPPPVLGVHGRSWAHWLAMALELPFTGLGQDGALVEDVLREQAPRVTGPYDLGTIYAGVNDVRRTDFDVATFERALQATVEAVRPQVERLLLVALPVDLGRPRAGTDVLRANEVIEREAAAAGGLVLDLRAFAGRRLLMPDRVHPTALGQLAIADAAARLLGAPLRPSTLAEPLLGRRRAALRYGAHYAAGLRRQLWHRAREGTLRLR